MRSQGERWHIGAPAPTSELADALCRTFSGTNECERCYPNPRQRKAGYSRWTWTCAEKYVDLIETYASPIENDWVRYHSEYLPQSERREAIMGLVQRCREEGRQEGRREGVREGLLAGIELGLELRFGAEGLRLMAEIGSIEDLAVLKVVHEALKTADTPQALRSVYAGR